MKRSAIALILLSSAATICCAVENPVGYWRLGEVQGDAVANLVGDYATLHASGEVELVERGDSKAMLFPGNGFHLVAQDVGRLAMSDAVTMDAWVRVDAAEAYHTILDKGGERYRLQISEGHPFFGLKSSHSRADLVAPSPIGAGWVRLTAVFERPLMRLFVNGEQVAERRWDHQLDVGRDLFVGSKSGRTDFFKGAIDSLVIYDYARLPQLGDYHKLTEAWPSRRLTGPMPATDAFVVERVGNTVKLTADEWSVVLGPETVETVIVRDKALLRDNAEPLLSGRLLIPTADGEGIEEWAIVSELGMQSIEESDQGLTAHYKGVLHTVGSDQLRQPVKVTISIPVDFPRLAIGIQLEDPADSDRDYIVERLAVNIPLSLSPRKRVAQGGENGVNWDTRYFYQYFINTHIRLMAPPSHWPEPEVNIWRTFAIDQLGPEQFTIWRRESETTSNHVMQQGTKAAGWMAIYDSEGGAFYGVNGLSEYAPIGLYADAGKGGVATVFLHPPTATAEPLWRVVERNQGGEFVLDVVFFPGELPNIWPLGYFQRLGYDEDNGTPDLEELAEEFTAQRTDPGPDGVSPSAPHISGGLPVEWGTLWPGQTVTVFHGDQALPTQSEALGYWPDGSLKWVRVTFPEPELTDHLVAVETVGDFSTPFEVTYRNREPLDFTLRTTRPLSAPTSLFLAVQDGEETVHVDTGSLQAEFGTGANWLRSLVIEGQTLLTGDQPAVAAIDFVRLEDGYQSGDQYAPGEALPGVLVVEELSIERNGPQEAMVLLRGTTDSVVPAVVHLRFEFHRQRSLMRVFYTVEFLEHDPRSDFVRDISFRLPLALGAETRVRVGDEDVAIEETGLEAIELLQDSPLSYTIRAKESYRAERILERGKRSEGWMQVEGTALGVTAVGRDLWAEYPKSIEWDAANATLTVGMWPRSVAPMDVRRYSDFPHRSQGESVVGPNTWVEDSYYPNDPFAGTTRTQEFLLDFSRSTGSVEAARTLAADFQRRPLVYAGADAYRDTGVVLEYPALDDFPQFAVSMDAFVDFMLFHKDYWSWYGFWNNGDIQHHFRSGYGRILPPDALERYLQMSPAELDAVGRLPEAFSDYVPQHDWASDNGRWGWTNTEGLPNLWLQNEYLRTGRRDIFFAAEALARHSRDVVARHNGKWFGAGTRHGVQHWSDGHHAVRQTIQTETRIHYFLTGEPRTREFALRLNDEIYTQGSISSPASHSGHLYGILFAWELTGNPTIGEMLGNYLKAMSYPDGFAISQRVRFPGPKADGPAEGLNAANMFFHVFGGMHAALEYYNLTGDEILRNSLVKMAEALAEGDPRFLSTTSKVVGFGIQHAENSGKLRAFANTWLSTSPIGSNALANIVSPSPAHWSGSSSYLNLNIPGSLFSINSMPYLLNALGNEPDLEPSVKANVERQKRQGVLRSPRRLSWQSEFDDPAFDEYLAPWQPWRSEESN